MASLELLPPTLLGSFTRHFKSFQVIGLDFFEDPKVRLLNRCKYVTFVTLLLLFFTGQIFFFVKINEIGADFMDIANAIPCFLLVVQNIFKLIVISKKDRIRHIILEIAEMWPSEIQVEEKETILNDWSRRLRTLNACIFNCTAIRLAMFMLLPTLISMIAWRSNDDRLYLYPFQLYYAFTINSMWKYFLAVAVQVATGSVIHICVYQACDLLVGTLIGNICILMRLLQYDLENMKVHGNHDPIQAEESYQALKQIVRTHQKLVRLSEKINELYGGIIFTVVCFSSITICFFGFLSIVFSGERIQLIRNLCAFMEMLFLVFCITLPGQMLQDTSSGIADAAYHCLWYESNLRFRKIIFIIIARSQKPCRLTALGFSDMNFNAFCKICSSAWSYLSLINQMYKKIN